MTITHKDNEQYDQHFSRVCVFCAHFYVTERRSCEAFAYIPDDIWNGETKHTDPYPGDGDIRFQPVDLDTPRGLPIQDQKASIISGHLQDKPVIPRGHDQPLLPVPDEDEIFTEKDKESVGTAWHRAMIESNMPEYSHLLDAIGSDSDADMSEV